jgi:hypothetical protein
LDFIDLGVWGAPEKVVIEGGITIARYKNAAGQDWYETVAHHPDRPTGFAVAIDPETGDVRMLGSEVGRLEPGNKRVIVLPGLDAQEAEQDDLFYKRFDLTTGEFVDKPPTVPFEVSRGQALMALHKAGLLPTVRARVATHDLEEVRIWFDNATKWQRHNPYVLAISTELGLDEVAVDNLFLAAALEG